MKKQENDIYFMEKALFLAKRAYEEDEIPVGAVIVKDNKIIGCGYNKKEQCNNPLKHAELIAIEEACNNIGDWRLNDCEIYITLEPCMMCYGAIVETRINKIVYGLKREKQMFDNKNVIEMYGGVLEEKSLEIIQKFFKNKRTK